MVCSVSLRAPTIGVVSSLALFGADGGMRFGDPQGIPAEGRETAWRHRGPSCAFHGLGFAGVQ